MKYMLMLRHALGAGPAEGTPEFDAEMEAWGALTGELSAAGVLVTMHGLEPEESATTLRAPQGERVLTDGPYTEAKEYLFSFVIVDVPDLDAAVEWAAKMPNAEYGSVEIRPLSRFDQDA